MKDVLGYLTGQGAGKNVRWEFVEDIDREKLAAAALKAIKDEKRLSDYVSRAAGVDEFSMIEKKLGDALKEILGGVKDAA
jgi:hypothetical protein